MKVQQAATAALIAVALACCSLGGAVGGAGFLRASPIRIIVGLAPGGGTDVTARLIAQRLSASLGTNVYVENKPGGAFEPAYREWASAAPDGRTLFFISTATVVAQPSTKDYPFDVRKMAAVSESGAGPFILTARKELGFRNIGDLVAYAKKQSRQAHLRFRRRRHRLVLAERRVASASPAASMSSTCPTRARPRC